MGMDAAIKKRVSGEFKSEQRGATVSFSNVEQNSSLKREMKQQLTSFSEEKADEVRSVGTPFQQAGFQAAPLQEPAANVLFQLGPKVTANNLAIVIIFLQILLVDAVIKYGPEGIWDGSQHRGSDICSNCN